MRILLSGYTGRMGAMVQEAVKEDEIVSFVSIDGKEEGNEHTSFDTVNEDIDVVIDFSHHANTKPLMDFCMKNHIPCVVCTTGQTEEEKEMIRSASKEIPVFFSANMSMGIAALCQLVQKAAALFPNADIEIVETHHNRKLDVPSGTALMIANDIKEVLPEKYFNIGRHTNGKRDPNEIGIHSLRMGNECGTHSVYIHTDNECLTLTHETESRAVFADGALAAAKYLITKPSGLYTMKDLAGE